MKTRSEQKKENSERPSRMEHGVMEVEGETGKVDFDQRLQPSPRHMLPPTVDLQHGWGGRLAMSEMPESLA